MVYTGEKLAMKNFNDYILLKSKEINSFIVNLPHLNQNDKLSAIKFELMSVFPGNMDQCMIDYYQNKNNTIAFVSPLDLNLKYKNKLLISPLLIAQSLVTNGIIIFIYYSNFELIKIHSGEIISIKRYSDKLLRKMIEDIKEEQKSDHSCELKYYFCNIEINPESEKLINKLNDMNFILLDISKDLNKKILINSSLFNKKRNSFLFPKALISTLLLFLIFSSINIFYILKANKSKQKFLETKHNYEELKKLSIKEKSQSVNKNNENINYPLKFSLQFIFNILNSYDSYLQISYISISDNIFRIEGKCYDSLKLTTFLENNKNFSEIILNQAVKQKDDLEKFNLSGRLIND